MIKEKLKSMKELIDKEGEINNKKKIENLVVFIIILILTIIAINMIWKDEPEKSISNTNYTQLATTENVADISNIKVANEYNLEQDLEDILGKINGAGKVKVLITYSESSQIVPISNEKIKETVTDEGDKVGGTRKIQESDKTTEVIYQENSGKKEIITREGAYA